MYLSPFQENFCCAWDWSEMLQVKNINGTEQDNEATKEHVFHLTDHHHL